MKLFAMKTSIYSIVLFVFLTGCTTTIRTDNTAQKYETTESKKIEVYSNDKIGREYEILGEVSNSSWAGDPQFKIKPISDKNADATVNQLKKAAAKLGADAIINLRLGYQDAYENFTTITSNGTAIKFKN